MALPGAFAADIIIARQPLDGIVLRPVGLCRHEEWLATNIPAAHGFSVLIARTLTRMPALETLAVVGLQRCVSALSSTSIHAR